MTIHFRPPDTKKTLLADWFLKDLEVREILMTESSFSPQDRNHRDESQPQHNLFLLHGEFSKRTALCHHQPQPFLFILSPHCKRSEHNSDTSQPSLSSFSCPPTSQRQHHPWSHDERQIAGHSFIGFVLATAVDLRNSHLFLVLGRRGLLVQRVLCRRLLQ